jgi:hypothetical protein
MRGAAILSLESTLFGIDFRDLKFGMGAGAGKTHDRRDQACQDRDDERRATDGSRISSG